MLPGISRILAQVAFPIGLAVSMSASAFATTLYTWRNADGSLVFTDDPKGAPSDVQVRVWPERAVESALPTPKPAPVDPPALVETVSDSVTQGEFAVRLTEELGLGDRHDEEQASEALTKIRIAPRLGRWELDEPMTPELSARLRNLTAASAAEGWIDLTPEEGLLAFDTTAALLGVGIPAVRETDSGSGQYQEPAEPIEETPPLVYMAPPPPEYDPYYLWQPAAGYWWNGGYLSGIYVLDIGRYRDHHHHHRHHGDHQKWHEGRQDLTPDRIAHHFQDRVKPGNPRFRGSPAHRPPASSASPGFRRLPQRASGPSLGSSGPSHRVVRSGPPTSRGFTAPRGARSGIRLVSTPAAASGRGAISTDQRSHQPGKRVGAVRGRAQSPGFFSPGR